MILNIETKAIFGLKSFKLKRNICISCFNTRNLKDRYNTSMQGYGMHRYNSLYGSRFNGHRSFMRGARNTDYDRPYLSNPHFDGYQRDRYMYDVPHPVEVSCGQLRSKDAGMLVAMRGRIAVQNVSSFSMLKDSTGVTQIHIPDYKGELLKRMRKMPDDAFVAVVGIVQKRPPNNINVRMNTGEIEVQLEEIIDVVPQRKRKFDDVLMGDTKKTSYNQIRTHCTSTTQKKLTNEEISRCESQSMINEILSRSLTCDEITAELVGSTVKLIGWITTIRQNKFLELKDGFGAVQLVIPNGKETELSAVVPNVMNSSWVRVCGVVCNRKRPVMVTKVTGDIEISITDITIIRPNDSEETKDDKMDFKKEEGNKSTSFAAFIDSNGKHNQEERYNDYTNRTHTCGELRSTDVGKSVNISGWVDFLRCDKFILLRDGYGTTQVIIPENADNEVKKVSEELTLESVVSVRGIVCSRPPTKIQPKYKTGEIEVRAEEIKLLNKASNKLPFNVRGYNKAGEKLRNKYRYIGLRFPDVQGKLRLRSQVFMKIREFLIHKRSFVEVETPTLFKRTPGGAQEFIVPTEYENKYYCLVQSPQQFKQLLMIGSMDRYFQFARCYRDERTSPERQPEFTQLDIEMSFTTEDGIMKLVEDILLASWPEDKVNITIPFPRITYEQAIRLYGTDKPYLLDKLKIENVGGEEGSKGDRFYMLSVTEDYKESFNAIKSQLDVEEINHKYWIIDVNNVQETNSRLSILIEGYDGTQLPQHVKDGDLIILAKGEQEETLKILGKIRKDILLKKMESSDGENFEFLWVTEFPLFEMHNNQLKSAHHPFTHPKLSDVHLLHSQPLKVRGMHYDLVLNGSEIGGGSIRIHESDMQNEILKLLNLPQEYFNHMIDALKVGAPPHGGIALGMDRLLCIISGGKSIRDVIAFPKGFMGQDLLSDAPCDIPLSDKIRYHLVPPS